MQESEFIRVYVRPDITAVLTCPYCGRQKVILADPFRGYKHKLRVKCYCKQTFKVFLEFRKRMRKRVTLKGTYINHSQKDCKGDLVILDISVIGLTISDVDTSTFKEGDELNVEFTLDDEHGTVIRKDVIVRNVRQEAVGGEFEISDELVGPLGHYVMSKFNAK